MAKKEEISIFGGAKTKAPSVAKKDDKEVVVVKGLEEKLLEFEFIKAQIKDLTAQEKTLNSEIKDIAKEKFVELYQSKRSNPNTFLIKDGEGCVMILPSDAYIKIGSEARANELMEAYGDDAVTVDEQFVFNNSVLQRNMKAIEKAIRDAKGVSDDDKRDLIDRIVEFKVAKGFIDRLYEYGENMETVMNDIQPIISLKSCGGGRMEDGGELDGDFMGNIYGDGGGGESSFFDIYDEESGKTLLIKAYSLEQAEGISETIDFNDYEDGEEIDVLDDIANYESGEYRKGGRVYETGSAYKRDRAYKSNQPHELAYRRKTRPKNPRYKKDTSFFANGGGVDTKWSYYKSGDEYVLAKVEVDASGTVTGVGKEVRVGYLKRTSFNDVTKLIEELNKYPFENFAVSFYLTDWGMTQDKGLFKSVFNGYETEDDEDNRLNVFGLESPLANYIGKMKKYVKEYHIEENEEYAEGGGVEDDGELYYTQDYFEYVDWSGDGNNDGYLYGINLLDDNGDVLVDWNGEVDAEWFESDQERRNYVLENNLFEYKFKRGGKVGGVDTLTKNGRKVFNEMKRKKQDRYYIDAKRVGWFAKEMKITLDEEEMKDVADLYVSTSGIGTKGTHYADGGAVKTVFTKDGVEVEKGTDKYKGHIFYHSDGVGYMCLGYFPNLDDCMYRNMETGTEVVGCMDGFYYNNPMILTPSYSHGGMHGGNISTATLEEMVGRKLNGWNDDVVYFNGAKYQKLYLQPFYVIV